MSLLRSNKASSSNNSNKDETSRTNSNPKIGLRERIKHFTWANFTCTQSTGAMAILLGQTPNQFNGLQTAGIVIFIFNIVLIALFCTLMLLRFIWYPHHAAKSTLHPPEMFFTGSLWLSIATCIMCTNQFRVPHAGAWLIVAVRVFFWIYAAFTFIFSTGMFLVAFDRVKMDPLSLNPGIFVMFYSIMLTGTIAANLIQSQPPDHRMSIIVAGIAYQGLGWALSLLILPWYVGSLLSNGLGNPSFRPGLFLPVGTAAYTIVSLIGCSRYLPANYGYFATHPNAIEILQVTALWASIFIWMLSFWLFSVALVANLMTLFPSSETGRRPQMMFKLPWWALIFPNVGFTLATAYIGEELDSAAIKWVATAMTAILFAVWLMELVLNVKATLNGQIMWPGKD